jgi:F1F0 ATPase subunit 2
MNTSGQLLIGFLWGVFLGIFYFGGLWITVRMVPQITQPKKLLFISFILRLSGVLAGLWFVLRLHSLHFLATLAAFFLVRFIILSRVSRTKKQVSHANQP